MARYPLRYSTTIKALCLACLTLVNQCIPRFVSQVHQLPAQELYVQPVQQVRVFIVVILSYYKMIISMITYVLV